MIENRIPEVEFIAPRNVRGFFGSTPPTIGRNNKTGSYPLFGDFPAFTKIAPKKIYDGGRFINDEDIAQARKVAVIGELPKKSCSTKMKSLLAAISKLMMFTFR